MRTHPICVLVLFLLCAPTQTLARDSSPQSQIYITDKRPAVAQLTRELDVHVDQRGSEDDQALIVIEKLRIEFTQSGPKDKSTIVKSLSACFESPRQGPKRNEPSQDKLHLSAAQALGDMGQGSTHTLLAWINHKNLRHDNDVQRKLILSLGRTREKDALAPLIDLLEHKEPALVGAAAEALGNFADFEQDARKHAFERLVKALSTAANQKDGEAIADGQSHGASAHTTTLRDRYDAIAAPIMTTLEALSKHKEEGAEKWVRWWNKQKRADWDATAKPASAPAGHSRSG